VRTTFNPLAAAALVGATALVVAGCASSDEPEDDATTDSTSTAEATDDAMEGGEGLPEELILGLVPSDEVDQLVTDGDVLYALSTAPGATEQPDQPVPQAVYRSTDGVSGTAQPVGDGIRMSDLAARGGRLYAVGTAPSTASSETSRPVAAWSDDGGATWSTAPLPLDLTELGPGVDLWIGHIRVEAAPAGVVAMATVYGTVDPADHLPEGTDLSYGYTTDPTGVTVYCPPSADDAAAMDEISASLCEPASRFDLDAMTCVDAAGAVVADYSGESPEILGGYAVASTHTWDELGLPPAIADYVDGRTLAFH